MNSIPNPAQFAAALAFRGAAADVLPLDARLRRNFDDIVSNCEDLGINVSQALQDWIENEGREAVSCWVDVDSAGSAVIGNWKALASTGAHWTVLATLVHEEHLARRGEALAAYFKSERSSYAEELLAARRRVAFALVTYSYDVPFHRAVVHLRVLDLAIEYLQSLIDHDRNAADGKPFQNFTVRELGKMLVVRARFAKVQASDLVQARELLKVAARERRDKKFEYLTHFVEGCIQHYHLTGERASLTEAVDVINADSPRDDDWPTWYLNAAEVWLALVDSADTEAARRAFLVRSKEFLSRANNAPRDYVWLDVRHRMLSGFVEYLSTRKSLEGVRLRGVRFPYGIRIATDEAPPVVLEAAGALANSLRPGAMRGQYAFRDFLSELLSYVARRRASSTQAVAMLKEAIALREPMAGKNALAGVRAVLSQATDLFLLAELDGDSRSRLKGLRLLADEVVRDEKNPDPMVLLGQEIELNGGVAEFVLKNARLSAAVRRGDSRTLYEMAAQRAALSPDMRRRGIGGRSGVVTVEDYLGFTGQTFVFKPMPALNLERDEARAKAISAEISSRGLADRFGVIEHLTTLGPLARFKGAQDEVVSVRRFVSGRTLRRMIETDPVRGLRALVATVEFLALFHCTESLSSNPSFQRDTWRNHLGRWLRQIADDERQARAIFERWHGSVASLPLLRRRDAHSLNWIVDSDDRVLAVDLDSVGYRPVGYELAQLLDDNPIFEPAHIELRARFLDQYVSALREYGASVTHEQVVRGFEFGLVSRSVGLLTDPAGTEHSRIHGLRLLESLSKSDLTGSIASEILRLWNKRSGLSDADSTYNISVARRLRISKAMSFNLRHNPSAPLDEDGWIEADSLASLLNAAGHGVESGQLIVVAGAMGEPRFELRGSRIRARYGHTRSVGIEYAERQPPEALFHGTSAERLSYIFEARAGLTRMERRYVHMSDDPDQAMLTARRHGAAVFVLSINARAVSGLVYAASTTWLAPQVPVDLISVLTPRQTSRSTH